MSEDHFVLSTRTNLANNNMQGFVNYIDGMFLCPVVRQQMKFMGRAGCGWWRRGTKFFPEMFFSKRNKNQSIFLRICKISNFSAK